MDDTRVLIRKAQNNDLPAFEELVRLYQNKVYTLCVRLAGNYNDAQDLAQEAFIRAYRAIGSFRNEADFGTWIYRIAVNVWLNVRRKNDGQPMVYLDEPYQGEEGAVARRDLAAATGDPLQELEEKEFRGLVRVALDGLSEEHRTVLVLRDMEGYSYEDISRMQGCSLGTVKSRLNRAREAMRRRMNELAAGGGELSPAGSERR